jgi:hypothetical protein
LNLYLEHFTFIVKHKSHVTNNVADELSRWDTMHVTICGFYSFSNLFASNPYFSCVITSIEMGEKTYVVWIDSLIFKGNQLYTPNTSLRLKTIKQLYDERHRGRDETIQLM